MLRGAAEVRLNDQIRMLFQSGSLGALSDGHLLDRYASNEGEISEIAFAALVERHGPMVLGVCRRLIFDAHLAEDAFQATFLVLARRARSIRHRDSLGGWLHRVAHRIATRSRGRCERHRSRERPGVEEVAVKLADRVERDELRTVIDQEIDRLRDDQRLPVILCCLEGVSHEEASQRLNWPVGTLKSRLARGRLRLQERLVRRGFAPAALAAGGGLVGVEASAAVPPALIEATTKAALAAAGGGILSGAVRASLSGLVQEELGSMFAAKVKLASAAMLTAGASAIAIGLVVAAAPSQRVETGALVAAAADKVDEPKVEANAPKLAARLSASGRVVDSSGNPIIGAQVFLREWSVYRVRGMPSKQMENVRRGQGLQDILAETTTDQAGRFRFQDVPAPAFPQLDEAGNSVYPWDVVALAPGHGVAWAPLTPQNQRAPVTLKLGPEGILRGRLVEPGGKGVVGARVQVFGIDPLGRPDQNGLGTENRLNLSWSAFPLGATTDPDGRFIVRELPRDIVLSLVVTEPRHERLFAYAATSDQRQPDAVIKTFRYAKSEEIRMPVHTGEFSLIAKVADHLLIGRVVREADGAPAAKAQVIHNGNVIKADEHGRFRIEGLVSGKLELHVGPDDSDSSAAALAAQVEIPETPREVLQTFTLPRGLVVSGRVLDSTSGAGVPKALVAFNPKYDANQTPTLFGFSKETDANGRFRLVVPPGRGTVVLQTFPQSFPQPKRRYIGEPEDPKYSREVEGRAGQTIEVADFKLARGREVVLRLVNADGVQVAGARVDVRDPNRPFNAPPGRTDENGRYPVDGLSSDQSTVVDVIDEKGSLGATFEIPEAGSGGATGPELEIRLLPLISLSGRVLDEDGKPLIGAVVQLYRDVIYPGHSGRSFGVPIATTNEIKGDGTYTFGNLIAGATYNTRVEVSGHATSTSAHTTLKLGAVARLDDFRLPIADQQVQGVVVDPRGKPLPGITVSYQTNRETTPLYAPTGGVWFHDTDEMGRFHLIALPRGPIKLMVYRSPKEADVQIKGIKYADVRAGDASIRIELPDANDRLRGVE